MGGIPLHRIGENFTRPRRPFCRSRLTQTANPGCDSATGKYNLLPLPSSKLLCDACPNCLDVCLDPTCSSCTLKLQIFYNTPKTKARKYYETDSGSSSSDEETDESKRRENRVRVTEKRKVRICEERSDETACSSRFLTLRCFAPPLPATLVAVHPL